VSGPVNFSWPEEALTMLRKMATDRLSYRQASVALSERFGHRITRNAVIGKASRLGVRFNSASPLNTSRDAPKKRPAKKPPPSRIVDKAPMVALVPVAPVLAPIVEPAAVAIPRSRRVTIDGLTDKTCRWPIGDPGTKEFRFCGAGGASLVAGRPYCDAHMLAAKGDGTPGERSAIRNAKRIAA
jgi:GcrA cell cycle regulator